MNRKYWFTFFLSVLVLLSSSTYVPALYAQNSAQVSVDRNVVSAGDSLTLTIRIDGSADEAPDYSPLQKDFEVFGSSQNTQHALINGKVSSRTEWQTTLIPKRSGQLTIPPLTVNGTTTQPLVIKVNAAAKSSASDGSEPVFIETVTDRDSVYVQQQLLFTVRVFVAVQLDNLQLTRPEFDNASVKQLEETSFRREINGTPYAVHEVTYAIFPQQAGELTIPELVFSGVEVTRARSLFDFPGQGRALRRMSQQLRVHVKPIPASFSGSVWLPVRNLTLSESWGGNPHHLSAGESITRSVAIRADGALAAQLPALEQPILDNAKIYADQPSLDDQQDNSGLHGKRVENMALIPSRAGPLRLPETRIVWWDIDSDSEKVATLAGETLTILPGAADSPTPAAPAAQTTLPTTASDKLTEARPPNTVPATLWQLLCAGLALLWLATLYLYWRTRARAASAVNPLAAPENAASTRERDAWQALSSACRANEPAAARNALLQWSRIYLHRPDLRNIDQLQQLCADAALTRELQQLDNRLFGVLPDSGEWNGENLLQVVKNLKQQLSAKQPAAAQLPPLYPIN